jgi:hypothetical protein
MDHPHDLSLRAWCWQRSNTGGLSGKKKGEKAVFEKISVSSCDVASLAPCCKGSKNINLSKSDSTAKSFRRTFYLTTAVLQGSRAVQTTISAQVGHRYRSKSTLYMPSRISVVQGADSRVTVVGALLSVFPLHNTRACLDQAREPHHHVATCAVVPELVRITLRICDRSAHRHLYNPSLVQAHE